MVVRRAAYRPWAVHEATHVPTLGCVLDGRKSGAETAQLVHSVAAAPRHEAHVGWQPTHVSIEVGLPPEHA